jgi:cytochrome c-type biogenesis protein CcmH/NrfF
VLADSFLTGAILTWAIPLAVLLIVGIYWGLYMHKRSDEL